MDSPIALPVTVLPLAFLAIWSPKDRWYLQIGAVLLCVWWQPVALPISALAVMVCKLAGLVTVGAAIVARLREPSVVKPESGRDAIQV